MSRPESEHKGSSIDEKIAPLDVEFVLNNLKDVAVGADLVAGHADEEISPEEISRLRAKVDWRILPLLCLIYTVQFIDKGSLASSAILGIIPSNHLTQNLYNNVNSAFYIGYLIFVYPQNVALQHFPVGKWLSFNIFLWCIFIGLHPTCSSYGGLFTLRFLLGASEGCITAGLVHITSMYYTQTEIGERIGWTFSCNGVATIISGFLSFGVFHVNPKAHPNQWQWLFVIITILTIITLGLYIAFFPDNPATASFLTEDEKVKVIRRVQKNKNGIETKKWKKYQFIEAVMDPKTWLFFLYGVFGDLASGIGVEYSLVIKQFGFTTLQTTLLNIPSGAAQIIGILAGCYALRKFPNARTWIALVSFIPAVICSIVEIALPHSNKVGHIIGIYLFYLGSSPAIIMILSWLASANSGHTKKTTATGIFLVGYSLGQVLASQPWKAKYQPRNVVPWSLNLMCFAIITMVIIAIRYILNKENKRRDALLEEARANGDTSAFEDFVYIDIVDSEGVHTKKKIEKSMLDLTDKENLSFRYVL